MAPVTKGRRWASRQPRQLRKHGKSLHKKQRNKPKVSHKPRLVRRYKRRKSDDAKAPHPTAILKHTDRIVSTLLQKIKDPASKLAGVEQHNDVAADRKTTTHPAVIAELTAIPNPIPETGITLTGNTAASDTVGAGSPLLGTQTFDTATAGLSIINPTTVAPLTSTTKATIHTTVSSFSALPPLLSLTSSLRASAVIHPVSNPTSTSSITSPSSTSDSSDSTDSTPRQISVALVILVSVGGALLLLGFCIVVKMCTRPRKLPRPKPSLPILKDGDKDEDFYETKESPLFGGRERMSDAIAGNGPGWNWVQYPHTKLSGPTGAPLEHSYPSQAPGQPNLMYSSEPAHVEPRFNFAMRSPVSPPVAYANQTQEHPPVRSALQNNVPPSAMKRMSRQSMSFYAPSNAESPLHDIREETAFTGDGNDVLKRSRSKSASRRFSQPDFGERKQRHSTVSFAGLAYDGEEVLSPTPMEYGHVIQDTPAPNGDFAGRARVKSGYFATGTYPRMSTLPNTSYSIATATRINVGQRNSFSKDKLLQQKGNSQRMRDTQALTYALGLASPHQEYGVSPQTTLYPDDSVSVMDGRRLKTSAMQRKMAEAIPDVPVLVPTAYGGGSADSLMGMNFGVSQMSLSGLALGRVSEGDEERDAEESASSSSSSRSVRAVVDKAPRVPSPPPLPSLAQMGLARNNPDAYDNYRSPTYSLYGLYQTADRRSFAGR